MKGISELSYIVIEASDLNAWRTFAERLGFQVIQIDEKTLHLRMDEQSYRIIISKGEANDIKSVGWSFPNKEQLLNYINKLSQYNVIAKEADIATLAARQAQSVYMVTDPNGVQHEFLTGLVHAEQPFVSKELKSKFLTEQGLGHILIAVKDKDNSLNFYQNLGLSVTDTITEELAPGMVIDATFMHVNERHHSFAFAPMPPGHKKLHHFMIEVQSIDDVGFAYDRCRLANDPMTMNLGKHPNDEMFSFYVESPSGFAVELGYGGKIINYEKWEIQSYDRLSSWGHKH